MSSFLSAAERTKLSNYPKDMENSDLGRFFTLTHADMDMVQQQRSDYNRLGFALQLSSLRYLGFIPDNLLDPPPEIVRLLAYQLKLNSEVLDNYGEREQTRSDHLRQIMAFLGFRRATPIDLMELEAWLADRALEHDDSNFLLLTALDRLRWDSIVRPGLSSLERIISAARQQARVKTFELISPLLTEENKAFLDSLLVASETGYLTQLGRLQSLPNEANAAQINDALTKIRLLQDAGVADWDVSAINPNRLKILASCGFRASNQSLQRTAPLERYPILIGFLKQTLLELTDTVIDLVCDYLWTKHNAAKNELDELRLKAARSTNEKMHTFNQFLKLILESKATGDDLNKTLFETLEETQMQQLKRETDSLIRPKHDEAIDFFAHYYGYLRKFIPQFLATFEFSSHKRNDPLLKAISLIKQLDTEDKRTIPKHAPLSFVSDAYWPYVLDDKGKIVRRYYELSVLWELRKALRSEDMFVATAKRYADPASHLIPKAIWLEKRPEVLRLTQTPATGEERLQERSEELYYFAEQVERAFKKESWLHQDKDKWVLTPLEREDRPQSVEVFDDQIGSRLPKLDITDVVIEVDGWVDVKHHLKHITTGKFLQSAREHHYLFASLLAQGLNHGLTQMAKSTLLPHHQLVYMSNWYLTEDNLKAANTALVNYHHRLTTSQQWGAGTLSSSDGQRLPLAGKNRQAKSIPKYFGYRRGITFYSWTSDQFSQYGGKAIPSTVRDATYVLDEILANETDLPVLEHSSDTSGYTEIVFALFDLLGLTFTPRIRDLQDLQLYRTDDLKLDKLPKVRARLSKRINTRLILEYWDEMLRFVGSLKLGYVTASLVIQKLQAASRRSQLAKALQEYGRLIKTIHVLSCYASQEKRRWTGRQLNKGESVHELKSNLTIGNKGVIRKKTNEGLQNQVLCLNLLANSVIVWNTMYMTKALKQLEAEGHEISQGDLRYIWPTKTAHINMQGKYFFNLNQTTDANGLRPLRDPRDLSP